MSKIGVGFVSSFSSSTGTCVHVTHREDGGTEVRHSTAR